MGKKSSEGKRVHISNNTHYGCLIKNLTRKIQWDKTLWWKKSTSRINSPLWETSIQRLESSFFKLMHHLLESCSGRDLVNKSTIILLEHTSCILISLFLGSHECRKTLTKYAFFYLLLWIFPSGSKISGSSLLQFLKQIIYCQEFQF